MLHDLINKKRWFSPYDFGGYTSDDKVNASITFCMALWLTGISFTGVFWLWCIYLIAYKLVHKHRENNNAT